MKKRAQWLPSGVYTKKMLAAAEQRAWPPQQLPSGRRGWITVSTLRQPKHLPPA